MMGDQILRNLAWLAAPQNPIPVWPVQVRHKKKFYGVEWRGYAVLRGALCIPTRQSSAE